MSGIYIHIPFCKKACHYCDFHFSTSLKTKESLVDAICHEIEVRKDYLGYPGISTIYFGGGTPSVLSFGELQEILEVVHEHFSVAPNAEITLEANPDDLTTSKIKDLKDLGINRLSIGIQSFFDEDLILLNRSHTAEQAVRSVKEAQQAGFENITIDLIYGLPNLSMDKWEQNLQKAFELGVPHLSAYNLTVERKTALDHMVKTKKVVLPPESLVIEQFQLLIEETKKHGFIHYEISNFGKEGKFSWHNSSYWKNERYLGIGPSAHSYNSVSRQWNVANNAFYIKNVGTKEPWFEVEVLTEEDKYNEHIMTRLRTIWGIDLTFVKKTFGADKLQSLLNSSKSYISSGHIQHEKETITLTQQGKLLADKIASDLFL